MKKTQRALGIAAGVVLVASGQTAAFASSDVQPASEGQTPVEQQVVGKVAESVRLAKVEGDFSFTQDAVDDNATIAKSLYRASKTLCGSDAELALDTELGTWDISVSGDVANAYTASMGELAERGRAKVTMGCTCAGNPVDGRASVSANVAGITVASIVEAAQPNEDVNTITFVSADGFAVSLPLSYVQQRYSMIVYEINGDEFSEIAGSANQLWLGSTSARYFAQNVKQIVLSAEESAPPIPGTPEAGDAYDNIPNVSVRSAT